MSRPSRNACHMTLVEPAPLGQLAHGVGVLERGVHVAGAGQAEQVQRAARALGRRRSVSTSDRVRIERAVLDRLGRCARCPGRRCARRPGSGGRPRCCPSARRAGRRRSPRRRSASRELLRRAWRSCGVRARRMALPSLSGRSPNPSRTTSTTRGDFAHGHRIYQRTAARAQRL